MNKIARKLILSAGAVLCCATVFGQYDPEASVNPNSLFNIPVYEQVYKVRVWRDMYLNEKQNKGFFARGNEMTRVIVEAIKSGEIAKVYKNDSLSDKSVFTKTDFFTSMQMKVKQDFQKWDLNTNYVTTDRVNYNGKDYECTADNVGQLPDGPPPNDYWSPTTAGNALEFGWTDMYKLELMEDIIFDKRRSRLYYDIQGFQIFWMG